MRRNATRRDASSATSENDYVIRIFDDPGAIDADAWNALVDEQASATPFMLGSAASSHGAAAPATAPAATAAPASSAVVDGASFKVEGGVVKFYFASGKADLASGANDALTDIAKGVAGGKKAVVSGYTDSTGDAAKNEELAKQRAVAVRDALKAAGIAEDRIELKKPEVLTGSGTNADARRVEVALQ